LRNHHEDLSAASVHAENRLRCRRSLKQCRCRTGIRIALLGSSTSTRIYSRYPSRTCVCWLSKHVFGDTLSGDIGI